MNNLDKIKKLSLEEKEVLNQIAINIGSGHPLSICEKLIKKGLIEQIGTQEVGKDILGLIDIPVWGMPIDVHIDWCSLCDEEVEDEDFI